METILAGNAAMFTKHNKKAGVESNILPKIIIAIVFVVVAVLFINNVFDNNETVIDKTTCKTSVLQNSLAVRAGTELGGIHADIPIQCPTEYLTVEENADEEDIYKTLSEEMYECWDDFGKGELSLFGVQRAQSITYCVVCDVITFENPDEEISVEGLQQYWEDNKPQGSDKTYLEEFSGIRDRSKKHYSGIIDEPITLDDELEEFTPREEIGVLNNKILTTENNKAIVFSQDKKTALIDRWLALAGGGTVGVIAGATISIAIIAAAPVTLPAIIGGGVILTFVGATTVGTGLGLATLGFTQGGALEQDFVSGVYLIDYKGEALKNIGCEEISA